MPAREESKPFIALTEQWLEAWQQAAALSHINLIGIALCWDPQLRSRWFAQLSQMSESYMRSPAFLEMMQHSLRTITSPAFPCGKTDRRESDGDQLTPVPRVPDGGL
jgi:hypothetical protein